MNSFNSEQQLLFWSYVYEKYDDKKPYIKQLMEEYEKIKEESNER